MNNKLVIGILAHVDAGKTTLSESLLYLTGKIRALGRVDNKNAFLDTYALEKSRGITIFSKQAVFQIEDTEMTLLDTPGHVDFSSEMERTLQVLDYAILVISATDGVQPHTKTLWKLLEIYQVPVFIFVNKMDQQGANASLVLEGLKKQLNSNCIAFEHDGKDVFYEELAMCEESIMESYLSHTPITQLQVQKAVRERVIFPCYFGSALKLEGIDALLRGLVTYTQLPVYPEAFGAKVFKINRDEQGNRLTHLKITGGSLKVKDLVTWNGHSEKVNQIRIYSGQKYESYGEVHAGTICAVTGLQDTRPGIGIGTEAPSTPPVLEPVLNYQLLLPHGVDPKFMLPKLRLLEEEDPELKIKWIEALQEINIQMMGEIQTEVLKAVIHERWGVEVTYDEGSIVYKETIANLVEGVGHFEPLKHYAEVHLLMSPLPRGEGTTFSTQCSEDILPKNWQRLVLSHLDEKQHRGVLTGAEVTDIAFTLVNGKAHLSHTEGGDFREATYRAVRQGLKEAQSILLEPYYAYELEISEKLVGRAMSDIDKMFGTSEIVRTSHETTLLAGRAPVVKIRHYQKEVIAYSKGEGRLNTWFWGYDVCHNAEEVIAAKGYDSETDLEHPTGSVFCSHGSGYIVSWDKVKENMHLEAYLKPVRSESAPAAMKPSINTVITQQEVEQIIAETFYANQGKKAIWQAKKPVQAYYAPLQPKPSTKAATYLLVDGYNVIFAWSDLHALALHNMDSAKQKLLDTLSNYQAICQYKIVVVFDAYRVERHLEETLPYLNIFVTYTKEAQTADHFIEKFAHQNKDKYRIIVATSDGLQQMIIRGAGCELLSARELKKEIEDQNAKVRELITPTEKTRIADVVSNDHIKQMRDPLDQKQ